MRYLIEKMKCSPDVETSDGLTLLDYACGNLSYDEFSAYVPDPEQEDEATQAQAAIVKYLMNKCDYDPANVLSLFAKACKENNLKIAKLLCTNTDIVNTSDAEGNTPLHIACIHKHLELVKFLTEGRKCNQQVKNRAGKLPLHIACECGSPLELVSNCDINTQTTLGKDNNLKIAKLLCRYTDIVNYSDTEGNTPLHIACMWKCLELVKFLTEERKCNQQVKNRAGKLPLHIACECGSSLEIVKLVSNCDTNTQTTLGDTPLHMACRHGETMFKVIEFLIKLPESDQTIHNNDRELPLHIACGKNCLDVVKLLDKCDFNAQTALGNTPLHIACRNNGIEVVKFLTERCGCDQTIQNKDGELPLHIACSQSSLAMVELIDKCDFNAQTALGNTPLHIACRNDNVELVRFLAE